MSSYVRAELRRQVEERAGNTCEYCLTLASDTYFGCHVDHVIAEKHGGLTESENLALACAVCNRAKGTDIASLVATTGQLVRLFNLRVDRWDDHFRVDRESSLIEPVSDIGIVTCQLLGFNDAERVLERKSLARIGHFPQTRLRPK